MAQIRARIPILGQEGERQVLKINAETLKNMFAIPTGETGSSEIALEQAHVLKPQSYTVSTVSYETLILHTLDSQLTTSASDYTEKYDTGKLGVDGAGYQAVGADPDVYSDIAAFHTDGTNLWTFKNIRYFGNDGGTIRTVDAPAILKFPTDANGELQVANTVGNRVYLRNDISPITSDEFVKMVTLGNDLFGIIYDESAESGTYFTFDTTLNHNQTSAVIDTSISNFLGAKDIIVWDGYVVALDDSANTIFHSNLNDATTYTALDALTTTWTDRKLQRLGLLNNNMWVFADDKIRVYYNAGNPIGQFFNERQGVAFNFGIGPRRTLVDESSSLIWLDNELRVVQATSISQIRELSTPIIRETIGNLDTISDAYGLIYKYAGRKFYHLTFPTEDLTLVCDLDTGLWHSRSTTVNSSEVEHAAVASILHKDKWHIAGTEQSDDDESETVNTSHTLTYTALDNLAIQRTHGINGGIVDSGNLEVMASGELILNGITLDGVPSTDGNSTTDNTASAAALATAINASTGVSGRFTASALATDIYFVLSGAVGSLSAGEFTINGTDITGAVTDSASLVTLINAASITPAVTASVETGGPAGVPDPIKLEQASGYNIQVSGNGLAAPIYFSSTSDFKIGSEWILTDVGDKFNSGSSFDVVTRGRVSIAAGTDSTLTVGGTKPAELGFQETVTTGASYTTNASSDSIYKWDETLATEYGSYPVLERTSQHLTNSGNMVFIDRLMLDLEVVSGSGTETCTLEYSKDGGNTWSSTVSRTLPLPSENSRYVQWDRLGQSRRWTFRLKSSDGARFSVLGGWADVRTRSNV